MLRFVGTTEEQRISLRSALLERVIRSTDPRVINDLLTVLIDLSRTFAEQAEVRAVIVNRIRSAENSFVAGRLMDKLAELNPIADDLCDVRQWQFAPRTRLLAAVRSNTPVSDWITLLQEIAEREKED